MTGQRRPRGQGQVRRGGGALRPANDSQNGGWARPTSNNVPRSAISSPPQPLMQMSFTAKKSNSLSSSSSSKSSPKDNRNYLEELNQFCERKGMEKPSFKVIIILLRHLFQFLYLFFFSYF